MKRILFIMLLLTLLSVVMPGCHRSVSDRLAEVDRLTDVDLDSAVAILKTIDNPGALRGRDGAYFALLASRVGCRGKWVISDSLLLAAADYDWSDADMRHRLESNERYARVSMELGGLDYYPDALVHAIEAERVAVAIGDSAALASDKDLIAGIYNRAGKDDEALRYIDEAIACYEAVGDSAGKFYGLRSKIMLFINMQRDREAIALSDSLLDLYAADSAKVVNLLLTRLRAFVSSDPDRLRAGIDRLMAIDSASLAPSLYQYEVLLAIDEGRFDDARHYMALSRAAIGDFCLGNPALMILMEAKLEKLDGNLPRALELTLNYYDHVNDALSVTNTVDRALINYRQRQAERADEARRRADIRFWLAVAAVIMVVAAGYMGYRIYRRNKNLVIERLLDEIQELSRTSQVSRNAIGTLVKERFATINSLCDDYFELSDVAGDIPLKNAIFKNVKSRIREMSGPVFRRQLADRLNADLDNLFDRFVDQLPDISDADRAMFVYSAAGFTIKAIGIFLGLKKSSVYSRRRRLREAVEASQAPDRVEFASFLQ